MYGHKNELWDANLYRHQPFPIFLPTLIPLSFSCHFSF